MNCVCKKIVFVLTYFFCARLVFILGMPENMTQQEALLDEAMIYKVGLFLFNVRAWYFGSKARQNV